MRDLRCVVVQVCGLLMMAGSFFTAAATLDIEQKPLFIANSVKPNLIMALDDSGSMDIEMMFLGIEAGNLKWNSGNDSVLKNGVLQKAGDGFSYLFPNGSQRKISFSRRETLAIPPFEQYGFARSHLYNKMYYNPNVTYSPWVSNGSVTFSDIDITAAPSDPAVRVAGATVLNLTTEKMDSREGYQFRVLPRMTVPAGVKHYLNGQWVSNNVSTKLYPGRYLGVSYFPATYYIATADGTRYQLNSTTRTCNEVNQRIDDYVAYEQDPSILTGVDSLGPDGRCLTEVQIRPGAGYAHDGGRTDCGSSSFCTYSEEIQNFANWYSYYRKRDLTLRASLGHALNGISSLRTGMMTINGRSAVTMRDLSVSEDVTALYDEIYNLVGTGGTPNRTALHSVGQQYMRTDEGAPITEACQSNYGLLFTDGINNQYLNTGGIPLTGDENEVAPYGDPENSNTLADVAMHYYKTNLRPDFTPGKVPVNRGCSAENPSPQLDCNTNLHMNTYTVGFGVRGTVFGETHHNVADAYLNPPVWPPAPITGNNEDLRHVDDLYHAAVNGRGEAYSANSPQELQAQLKRAFIKAQSQSGSSAALSFNSSRLREGSTAYISLFDSSNWSGDVQAYALDSSGDLTGSSIWSAAGSLGSGRPGFAQRNIFTYNGSQGVPFKWNKLTAAQQNDLRRMARGSVTEQNVLDFLRGDRSNEAVDKLRIRSSILGDVVSSKPIYVGAPKDNWPARAPFPTGTGQTFNDFKTSQANRSPVIYAGANDGMLHGFNAEDGRELVAYIPSAVYSTEPEEGLGFLADPLYTHRYYVDQTPTVASVYLDVTSGSGNSPAWQTVLLGGLKAGGRSLFLLNITDPAQFAESDDNAQKLVLWEFSHPDLGYTYSKPTIAMMENGRWAAIFGNGYNATGDGKAVLFIVYLDGGLDGVWTDGSAGSARDYIILKTGVGSVTSPNGLATPITLDLDGNKAVDRVYAGDLEGNMWAFDLADASTRSQPRRKPDWKVDHRDRAGRPSPLFRAKDAVSGGTAQPITVMPKVVRHRRFSSDVSKSPNLMVIFGTGKYLEASDNSNTAKQTFYGVWDIGEGSLERGELVQQTIGTLTEPLSGEVYRTLSSNPVDYNNQKGWFIDLPVSGERIIVDPALRGEFVHFNTSVPTADGCSAGGYGYVMIADIMTGGEPRVPVFDTDNDGEVNNEDDISGQNPAGEKFLKGLPSSPKFFGNKVFIAGTNGGSSESAGEAEPGGNGTGETVGTGGTGTVDGGAGEGVNPDGEPPIVVNPLALFEDLPTGRLSWQELKP